MSVLDELRRRNVFRVAILYIAVAWLILQATDVLSSLLELPEWAGKVVVVILAMGFPLALVISWLYELTPEGIRRDSSDIPAASRAESARRLNLLTLCAAVLAITVIGIDRLIPERSTAAEPAQITADAESPVSETAKNPPASQAIAVLPFVNLTSDPEQEHLANGITEEILNLLANAQGLRVTSRTSAFSFKGTQEDLPTIARKLGVSYVVEGSVRKAGNSVRVTAQLIDVATDTHLWSQTYDRQIDDVFAIQSDVAGQIAHVLNTAMSTDELSQIGARPTENLAAWQSFVSGRSIYRSRVDQDDIEQAMAFVDAAITADPGFARAHSLRAVLLLKRAHIARSLEDAEDHLQGAVDSAEHALELNPHLGEPYFVLADTAFWQGRLDDAERWYREAVARAPNNADGRSSYGFFLVATGYLNRGWAEFQRAAELDPLSPVIFWTSAFAALTVGRLDVVTDFIVRSRENGFTGWQLQAIKGGVAMQEKRYEDAELLYAAALPDRKDELAASFAAIRKRAIDDETRAMLDQLGTYGPPGAARWHTEVHAGDLDAAYATAWSDLESAASAGSFPEAYRPDWWFPVVAPFRQDPRFADLMEEMGLMDFWRRHGWPDRCVPRDDTVVCH